MRAPPHAVGQTFGHLTVLCLVRKVDGSPVVRCRCRCGGLVERWLDGVKDAVKRGRKPSCNGRDCRYSARCLAPINVRIVADGRSLTMREWAKDQLVSPEMIRQRIKRYGSPLGRTQ